MEHSYKFFENKACQYYPCHATDEEMNCLFCFCPLYHYETCLGNPVYIEHNGIRRKSCHECTFPHKAENYEAIMQKLTT